jgi:NAD-dependent SIR2 family protein deacetylase
LPRFILGKIRVDEINKETIQSFRGMFMSNEMLLLGAGASVEAGIPDAKQMARVIIEKFNANTGLVKEAEVLNFVNERLIADSQKKHSDPTIDCVDIEALYNAILLLSERDTLEISPFVESWDAYLEKLEDADKIFERSMLWMKLMLRELTSIKDEHRVDYLKPILNLAKHQNRLFIATLNYDYAIELFSRANGIACDTGIKSWNGKWIFDCPNDGIHLIKLHGSNYWLWSKDVATYDERLPHPQIRVNLNFDEEPPTTFLVEEPMVIFGQRNKLTAEGPFLALLKHFDEQLQQNDILTVVGYSFRDTHINFYISKFLNQDVGKIRVIDPNFEASDVEYVQYLRKFREIRPEQIEVIEKYTGDALKELYPN